MAKASLLNLPLVAPPSGLRVWLPTFSQRLIPWLLPITVLALWWLASRNQWMSEQILPAPSLVWQSALELGSGEVWSHLAISLQRLGVGLLAGVSLGALLGATLGLSRRAERWVLPTFSALAQIPTLAWIPLFMVFFGIGEVLKLVLLIVGAEILVRAAVRLAANLKVRPLIIGLRRCGASRSSCSTTARPLVHWATG